MKTIVSHKIFSLLGITGVLMVLSACASEPSPWTKQSNLWDQRRDAPSAAPAADQYKQDLAAVDQATSASEVELSYQTEQVESAAPVTAEEAVAEPMESAVEAPPEAMTAEDEILNQPADYYTVQLFASVDIDRLYRFAEQNQLSVRYAIPTVRDGVTWYVLLLDVYPDYSSAKAGMAEVADTLSTKPWVRSLGSLQKLMQ
ncbi:MAG: hypothetical protein OQL06_15730 [Gammaproteobacteria bacterium]|nr:hypothetical protein [Gammaproteobacteria bacterium]